MATAPLRLDRIQAGIVASLAAALPSAVVSWDPSIPDGIAGDRFARCSIVSGFDTSPQGGECRPIRTLPTAATLTITAPLRVWISGMWWEADDRDDLLEQLDAEPYLAATYAASGAAAVAFAAPEPGDLYGLAATAGGAWTTTASAQVETLIESVSGVVSVDLFSRTRTLRAGAMADLQRWRGYLKRRDGGELLDRFGLALGGDPIRVLPLDALAGPRWDSRARATMTLTIVALDAAAAIPAIDTVGVALDAPDVAGSFTFEIT